MDVLIFVIIWYFISLLGTFKRLKLKSVLLTLALVMIVLTFSGVSFSLISC